MFFVFYLLSYINAVADIDINNYPLGISNQSMHDQLVADGFYFSQFKEKKIMASKIVILNIPGGEFKDIDEDELKRKLIFGLDNL